MKVIATLRERHKNRAVTVPELEATLELAQVAVEEFWDRNPGGEASACAQSGCKYRRYPASRYCMYHATGNDTFAARLRSAEAKVTKQR
jgi:hypothetical protein